MSNAAQEKIFQNDILDQMQSQGWLLGESNKYNKELALYPEDVIAFAKATQPEQWDKLAQHFPDTERNPNATAEQIAASTLTLDDDDDNDGTPDIDDYFPTDPSKVGTPLSEALGGVVDPKLASCIASQSSGLDYAEQLQRLGGERRRSGRRHGADECGCGLELLSVGAAAPGL